MKGIKTFYIGSIVILLLCFEAKTQQITDGREYGKVSSGERTYGLDVFSFEKSGSVQFPAENVHQVKSAIAGPNLTPFQPSGWDDFIVLSVSTGTNISAATLYDNQTIYLDWSVINNGTSNISVSFYTRLYIDGTLEQSWFSSGLKENYYTYLLDYEVGLLSAGTHTFQIITDTDQNVAESDENDNTYSRTVKVVSSAFQDIDVTPKLMTINQISSSINNGPSYGFFDNSVNNPQLLSDRYQSEPAEHRMGNIIPQTVVDYWKTQITAASSAAALPAAIDWSIHDSPVKSQGSCGSCWAFAATAYIENLGTQSDLSEQVVVSCSGAGDCENGGNFLEALQYFQSTGVPAETCYPYTATNGTCSNTCTSPTYKERITTVSNYLWGVATVDNLRTQLQNGPLVVHMLVPTGSVFNGSPGYTGGIFNYNGGNIPDTQGHAVLLVGYDDNQQCFKVKNSWGAGWGENGYFRIAYDDVTDDVEFGSYAVNGSGVFTQDLTGNSLTISNLGHANLSVTSITDNAAWLSASGFPAVPFTVAPGGSRIAYVSVDWSLVGNITQTATITITSDDPDEPNVYIPVTAIPLGCSLIVTPSGREVISESGSTTFSISSACAWTATSDQAWCTVSPRSGTGDGTISANFSANLSGTSRTATITLAVAGLTPVQVTVTQESPSASLTIDLKAGWNIFSGNSTPSDPDLKVLLQPLITAGKLLKVQDESGNSLENFGVFGGWVNNIGNLRLTEGYKIKVNSDCPLTITGTPALRPVHIPLEAGWNIIGYPHTLPADGKTVVQPLIDKGNLVKVQDEAGNSIEDFGIFGGWLNNIGNFRPGEGYKVKVSVADTLTIE